MTLNVANPLGYVYICPPVPYHCHDAYTGAGSGTNFDTVWIYSESIMNIATTAMGGSSVTTNNRRHTFLHEMGHVLTDRTIAARLPR